MRHNYRNGMVGYQEKQSGFSNDFSNDNMWVGGNRKKEDENRSAEKLYQKSMMRTRIERRNTGLSITLQVNLPFYMFN